MYQQRPQVHLGRLAAQVPRVQKAQQGMQAEKASRSTTQVCFNTPVSSVPVNPSARVVEPCDGIDLCLKPVNHIFLKVKLQLK